MKFTIVRKQLPLSRLLRVAVSLASKISDEIEEVHPDFEMEKGGISRPL
jgi:hypothetical protein